MSEPTLMQSLWRGPVVVVYQTVTPYTGQTMKAVAESVCVPRGISLARIKGRERTKEVCRVRHEVCWTLYEVRLASGQRRWSLPQIGRFLGERDHTSILNSVRRWEQIMRDEA